VALQDEDGAVVDRLEKGEEMTTAHQNSDWDTVEVVQCTTVEVATFDWKMVSAAASAAAVETAVVETDDAAWEAAGAGVVSQVDVELEAVARRAGVETVVVPVPNETPYSAAALVQRKMVEGAAKSRREVTRDESYCTVETAAPAKAN